MTNFALLQTNIAFCDPEANFKRVRELFAQAMAKDPRPDVVVLPEDWSAGFSDEMFHHMEDFVEPENGPSVTVLRELARQYQVWVGGRLHRHPPRRRQDAQHHLPHRPAGGDRG